MHPQLAPVPLRLVPQIQDSHGEFSVPSPTPPGVIYPPVMVCVNGRMVIVVSYVRLGAAEAMQHSDHTDREREHGAGGEREG